MGDIQDTVLIDFGERVANRTPHALVGTRQAGRYASRVRVATPQGSAFDGHRGVVVRLEGDTAFVRLTTMRDLTLPFGVGELEVLP